MRLIDADALKEKAWDADTRCGYVQVVDVEDIDNAPTIEERKTGKWVRALDGNDGHVRCDKCFKIYDWDTQAQYYNFCPNCGADMRGEQE